MPLIVPGITSNPKDKAEEWQNQLLGKKIGETSDHITFAKKDLPEETRIIKDGEMTTMDFKPNRLNVHVSGDGTVTNVRFG